MATKDTKDTEPEEEPAPAPAVEAEKVAAKDVKYSYVNDEELGPRLEAGDDALPLHNPTTPEKGNRYQRLPVLPSKVTEVVPDQSEPPIVSVTLLLEDGSQHTVGVA